LPENARAAYANGHQHDIPLITGSVLNEGNGYIVNDQAFSLAKYRQFLKSRFGENEAAALALFPASDDAEAAVALDRLLTVAVVDQPAAFVAQAMSAKNGKAYLYQFARRPDTAAARKMGAFHGVDLAYVFGNMSTKDGYTKTDFELSRQIMSYWVNFARSGNPNAKGLLQWPTYDSAKDINMRLGDIPGTERNLFAKERRFIEQQTPPKD